MESGFFFGLAPPQLGETVCKFCPSLPFFGVDSTLSRFRDFLQFTCAPSGRIPSLNPIGRPKLMDSFLIGCNYFFKKNKMLEILKV